MSNPSERPNRRMRGFEAAGGLLRGKIRSAGETRGFVLSRLLTHWADVVGAETAAQAIPVKIGYGKGGMGATLTLLVQGAAAPMVQMQLPRIKERVNGVYGYNAISRIHLTQTAETGFAEGQTPFQHRPAPAAAPPDPALLQRAETLSREIGDEGLRAALEALGQMVLSRREAKKG
ncbi:MAG: DciA family protein [Paracoccaceae bacterium]